MASTSPFLLANTAVELPKSIAKSIFAEARETSVVARLATAAPMTLGGETFSVYNGKVNLGVVGEGELKPVEKPTAGVKTITPHKVAALVIVSDELIENDVTGTFENIQVDLRDSVARALDSIVLHGENPRTGSVLAGQTGIIKDASTKIEVEGGDYTSAFLAAASAVGSKYEVSGVAADSRIKPNLIMAANAVQTGVPNIAVSSVNFGGYNTQFGRMVGQSATGVEKNSKIVVGDWGKVRYGFADSIQVKLLSESTIQDDEGNLIFLAQQNLKALLVETKIGAAVLDSNAFAVVNNPAA